MENKDNEKKQLLKKIFFQKYRIIKSLSSNLVFEGVNITTNLKVALKLENKITGKNILTNESYILLNIKGYGIPEIISFGQSGKYKVLIEELLGKSLQDLFELNDNEIPLKDICMIAIQLLERIEYIHSKSIIHRNINPSNFLIGIKNPSLIYIIDFANSKKYRSSRTGKHVKFNLNQKIVGDYSFISINSMRGGEQSRKDDLESFGYMIIYLLKGFLPWKEFENKTDKLKKIYELKKKISLERLCQHIPNEIKIYMEYCRSLSFEQKPKYEYLKGLFKKILIKNQKIDDNIFFWNKNKKQENKREQNKNNKIDFFKRKGSPFMRLYRKINLSLNNKIIFGNYSDRCDLNKNIKVSKTEKNISKYKEYKNEKDIRPNSLNRRIITSQSFINQRNFVYKKKNNISPIFTNLKKTNKKENFNKSFKINNNNSMKNMEIEKLREISSSSLNINKNNINNFGNNKDIIKLKMKDNKNKNDTFIPKCNIYKGNYNHINLNPNNKINYNNQNYIDNINIIGYLKNLNDTRIATNNLNNSNNRKKNKINFNNNNINKKKDINIQNFNTPRNNFHKYNILNNIKDISIHRIFHKKNKTNLILPDYNDNDNINIINNSFSNKKIINKDILNKYTNIKNIKNKPISNNKFFHINKELNNEIGRLTNNNNFNNYNNYNIIDNNLDDILSKKVTQSIWKYNSKIE